MNSLITYLCTTRPTRERVFALKRCRGGIFAVVASVLAPVGAGVAAADPVAQVKDTGDYRLTLSMEGIMIQSVPNMAAAPLVREGFITATARFAVKCRGEGPSGQVELRECPPEKEPLKTSLAVSAQVGCPSDLSGGLPLNPQAGLLAGTQGLALADLLPDDLTDFTQIGINPTVQGATPSSLPVEFKPGFITDVGLGTRNIPPAAVDLDPLSKAVDLATAIDPRLADESTRNDVRAVGKRLEEALNKKVTAEDLVVSVQNRHMVVDRPINQEDKTPPSCGGPVAIRVLAIGTVSTATSSDKVSMFSDIYTL